LQKRVLIFEVLLQILYVIMVAEFQMAMVASNLTSD